MKLWSEGSSSLVSAWCPIFTPAWTPSTEMNRANTCAVVMKSSVDEPGATTSFMATEALRVSSTKLEWVRMQPFGTPVEPEV